jgi:hypothetical protein
MANKENGSEIIEQGNIFFFYRSKIDTEEVEDIKMYKDFTWLPERKAQQVTKERRTCIDPS